MVILHFIWMFLKLERRKGVISPSFCLDVLKISMEMRGNDLNRQIYLYLKIFFFFFNLINKAIFFLICYFAVWMPRKRKVSYALPI